MPSAPSIRARGWPLRCSSVRALRRGHSHLIRPLGFADLQAVLQLVARLVKAAGPHVHGGWLAAGCRRRRGHGRRGWRLRDGNSAKPLAWSRARRGGWPRIERERAHRRHACQHQRSISNPHAPTITHLAGPRLSVFRVEASISGVCAGVARNGCGVVRLPAVAGLTAHPSRASARCRAWQIPRPAQGGMKTAPPCLACRLHAQAPQPTASASL